jgi:hypothetical protein
MVRGKEGKAAQTGTVSVGEGKKTLVGRGYERTEERIERACEVREGQVITDHDD